MNRSSEFVFTICHSQMNRIRHTALSKYVWFPKPRKERMPQPAWPDLGMSCSCLLLVVMFLCYICLRRVLASHPLFISLGFLVPLQWMALWAIPAGTAWGKGCRPSLHRPLVAIWMLAAVNRTCEWSLAKAWCTNWWVCLVPVWDH